MMYQDRIEIDHIKENIEVGISNLVEMPTSIIEQVEETINISIEGEETIIINLDEFSEDLIIEVSEPIEVTNVQIENVYEEVTVTITEEPYEEEVSIEIQDSDENIVINIGEGFSQVNADWNATSGPSEILNLPDEFPPSEHTHEIEDISGLNEELNSKADLVDGKVPYSQLPPISSSTNYVHEQSVPSKVWIILHSMRKYPSVTVLDSSGYEIEGEVRHTSINRLTIEFTIPFHGIATLN